MRGGGLGERRETLLFLVVVFGWVEMSVVVRMGAIAFVFQRKFLTLEPNQLLSRLKKLFLRKSSTWYRAQSWGTYIMRSNI